MAFPASGSGAVTDGEPAMTQKPRRLIGRLRTWNDDRGFGFIEPQGGGADVFIHIKAFPRGTGRPQVHQVLSFETEPDNRGRLRATRVQLPGATRPVAARRPGRPPAWGGASYFVIPLFALVFLGIAFVWGMPRWVPLLYLVASVVCFAAYRHDKSAAESGARRTPESTLILLGLVGGWPGAILAQQILRHKSAKTSFRAAFWASVVVNIAGLVWLTTPLER